MMMRRSSLGVFLARTGSQLGLPHRPPPAAASTYRLPSRRGGLLLSSSITTKKAPLTRCYSRRRTSPTCPRHVVTLPPLEQGGDTLPGVAARCFSSSSSDARHNCSISSIRRRRTSTGKRSYTKVNSCCSISNNNTRRFGGGGSEHGSRRRLSTVKPSGAAARTAPSSLDVEVIDYDHDDDDNNKSKNNSSRPTSTIASTSTLIKAYSDLAKAKLSALVVTTTAAGFVAGSAAASSTTSTTTAAAPASAAAAAIEMLPSYLDPHFVTLFLPCVVGTFLCSASASAVNQIVERHRDARMKRTQTRPLVTGALSPPQATSAAALWGVTGTAILYYGTNPVTAALGATNWFLYSVVYTSMKPISPLNTWVGAVVGAIPPVMGYSAAVPGGALGITALAAASSTVTELDLGSLCTMALQAGSTVPSWTLLAAGLYWWQLPHFFALSYMHRKDYARGGFQMVSGSSRDVNGDWTAECITKYSLYMATLPFISTALNMTTSMFAIEGMVLNAFSLRAAYKFQQERTNANARRVFLTSLWYLPCWLMLFLLHSKAWNEHDDTITEATTTTTTSEDHEDDEITVSTVMGSLGGTIRAIRSKGRDLCLHEAWATASPTANDDDSPSLSSPRRPEACPIVVGSNMTHEKLDEAKHVASEAAAAAAATTAAAATLPGGRAGSA